MTSEPSQQSEGIYGHYWDDYIDSWAQRNEAWGNKFEWPGDEWGSQRDWDFIWHHFFKPGDVEHWQRAVEIGPGSGKYTLRILGGSEAKVRAYDISAKYLEVCARRCQQPIADGRLSLHLLDINSPNQIVSEIEAAGWRRQVDAFVSIAAMVHVDLQYMIVYLLNAALSLKRGGKLVLTLADATSPYGFLQLLEDIRWAYPAQKDPRGSCKFEWLSPDLVRYVLGQLGFDVLLLENTVRDIRLVASLERPAAADALEKYIANVPPKGQA
jgi:hypothetical protein